MKKTIGGRKLTPLQRTGAAPLHQQVFLILRDMIVSGRFSVGAALPSEEDLVEAFSVSRVTIRKALSALSAETLIERRHGVGTFVAHRPLNEHVRVASSDHLQHLHWVGNTTSVEVLEVEWLTVPAQHLSFFECDKDARVQRAVRVRSVEGRPVFHVVTYLAEPFATGLKRGDYMRRSLIEILTRRGITISEGRQTISAVLADPSLAAHLHTKVGAALLQIKRYHYDAGGRPVEFSEVHADPAAFELDITVR